MDKRGFVHLLLILIVVGVLVLGSGFLYFKQKTLTPAIVPGYPINVYPKLSSQRLDELKKEFVQRNGSAWQITIDDYGFIDFLQTSGTSPIIIDKQNFTPTNSEKAQWENFIKKNADFFGIDNPSAFHIDSEYGGAEMHALQKINGKYSFLSFNDGNGAYPVIIGGTSDISLSKHSPDPDIDGDQLSIEIAGHFWPHLSFPATPSLSQDEAFNKLAGQIVTYRKMCGGESDIGPGAITSPYPCSPPLQTTVTKQNLSFEQLLQQVRENETTGYFESRLVYLIDLKIPEAIIIHPIFNTPQMIDAITGENLTFVQPGTLDATCDSPECPPRP